MALDLSKTTKEARRIYYEVLDDIGFVCIVDDVNDTSVLYKDTENPFSEMLANTKVLSFKIGVPIIQGSKIVLEIPNESTGETETLEGLCYSKPSQDPVSQTATVLFFNSIVDRERRSNVYNLDRTIKEVRKVTIEDIPVYIERISYNERRQDVGIQNDLTIKLICNKSVDLEINDYIIHAGNTYLIKDIDNVKRTETLIAYLSPKRE